MNKNQIVILRNGEVVENMMSKIQTPTELRKRIAKAFKGFYKVYFKSNGTFFVDGDMYTWMINPAGYPKQKKPSVLDHDIEVLPRNNIHTYFDPYRIYPNDIIQFPEFDKMEVFCCKVAKDLDVKSYYVNGNVNGRKSFISISDLNWMLPNLNSSLEKLKYVSNKTIRIDKVIRHQECETIVRRGLLTGKPIFWYRRPKYDTLLKTIQYTEL